MAAESITPALACDSHMHVYDARFLREGALGKLVPNATADDYRERFQARIGTRRTVVVTPRLYDVDNSVTLDAIARLGAAHTRGVGVLRPDVTDAELETLHEGGIRGIRFTLYTPAQAVVDFSMVEPLSRRIDELGWHVQLHWTAEQIAEHEALLDRLPSRIVFDHLGRLPLPAGTAHPAFAIISRLMERGRAWLKLSGPYLDSLIGEAGGYGDMAPIAKAWVRTAPDRLVWGSDWPHVTEGGNADDKLLFDLLADWAQNDKLRERILVDNPAELYGF
ncbi:putative 2-pyrone-4,6-dicarboxylic acid hydrolase [Caballeronia glathei]|uniref:2-pyrone-4,6-dicarboxylate hydrolase n=1 Tax=Caballeronia glathei TaxID=60547 RepID=A0A069PP68_9BURK|nr:MULTISPECIES: amidohydrolase family protein [Burkholderiaceae]KDR42217.1 2-pyrone-4,6-dicarboxylate hydrolase [Caballeronia glathei]TCK36840.1 putative TIM-barrel fold metal-dependent hydrolase [Paraburkholderia sp. BL8N3]CDY77214.1 putative 2-pyrone-4,6-dicarboxylic acid hydrolase [Caballeronia glathei]